MSSKQDEMDAENERLFGGGQSRPTKAKKRVGMSDDEIIASSSGLESSKRVPKWFLAILVVMVLIAFGLTVPFWGDRVDNPRPWFTWGHLAALAYVLVFGGFVYFMTSMYGSDDEDSDEGINQTEDGDDKK
ncbi:MAG: hypothetical protein Q9M17_08715 [Mariprofundus sp.]|nr:hypothetical protein [Mariprofundus sp.]